MSALARREVKHRIGSERATPNVTLSPKGRVGLRRYLQGPLQLQLVAETDGVGPDVGFIFGHTHKPFVEEWTVEGYPGPVGLYNTGGWVVDTAGPALTQGGVAVLLDDSLNAASLQFYGQTADGRAGTVRVLAPGDRGDENPLYAELVDAIDPAAEPWRAISAAAGDLVAQRHRLQAGFMRPDVSRR